MNPASQRATKRHFNTIDKIELTQDLENVELCLRGEWRPNDVEVAMFRKNGADAIHKAQQLIDYLWAELAKSRRENNNLKKDVQTLAAEVEANRQAWESEIEIKNR